MDSTRMPFPEAFEIDAVGPMPMEFHTKSGVLDFLAWFEDQPFITHEEPQYLVKSDDWQCFLTGMARAYRDVLIVVQAEPGEELEPVYQSSELEFTHLDLFYKATSDILNCVTDPKFSPPSGAPI
jgi:hypothetical protein